MGQDGQGSLDLSYRNCTITYILICSPHIKNIYIINEGLVFVCKNILNKNMLVVETHCNYCNSLDVQ